MKYDISTIKRKMLVKYPFFGSVIASVDYKESKDIPTAGTDGKTIYYNPDFLKKISVEEQTFIFAHEVCHIAFNHIARSKEKKQRLWNIATDAVINQFLKKDGLKIVDGGIDIPDAINYDAEQLYEKLLNEQQENNNVYNDTHSMWGDAVKKQKDEQKELKKKQDELQNMGEKNAFKKNLQEKKRQLEELRDAISKQALKAGMLTNSDIRNITNIGTSKPIIDWRYVLREAVKYDVDWSYKNATIEDGLVVANLEEQAIPETEIVLDTSGSINEILLKKFLRECKNILKHSKLKVGCFDTQFYGFTEIRTEKDIENMKFIGGGGTNFDVAVNAFSKRVENKIIFTDGEAPLPKTSVNAIWIVFGNTKINPKGGKVIYITSEQLDRLYSYEIENSSKAKLKVVIK